MNPYHPPKSPYLDILYEDGSILVANKPSGLLTVPGREAHKKDCLINRVVRQHPSAVIVHRLDLETSGLVVMALTKACQSAMGKAFQLKQVVKRYMAWVDGNVEEDSGEIDLPLFPDWPNRPLQMVDYQNGKECLTKWRVLKRESDRSLLLLTPVTGRSHQLRVHLKEIGHTILGDPLYGTNTIRAKAPRLMLHAAYLSFPHPEKKDKITFTLPPDVTISETGKPVWPPAL